MRKNLWLKVSAVTLAAALWLFVMSRGRSEISVHAPIEFENVPSGMGIVRATTTAETTLSIRGHERFLRNLSPESIRVALDLKGISAGRHTRNIKVRDVKLPPLIKLQGIRPSTVKVVVERLVKKTVPVEAAVTGTPRRGRVLSVEVQPKEITLEGVRAELRNIRSVGAEAVDVSTAERTFSREVALESLEVGAVTNVHFVNVRVVIEEKE